MERGKYFVLESGEGGGKSTQAELLGAYLEARGIECVGFREPGSTQKGEEIRKVLLHKKGQLSPIEELQLFEEQRAAFFEQQLIPALRKGPTAIVDRSCYSSLAYQGYGGGIDLELIKRLNDEATLGLRPDLAFIIDIDAETGLANEQNPDRFAEKGLEYHRRVNEGYRIIARENSDNTILIPYIKDGIDQMQDQIREHVDKLF